MRVAAIALASVVAGCGDPAIDLRLRLPADDVDLSCVAAVRVYAWGESIIDEPPNQCIVLDHQITGGFRDLEQSIKGKLELAIPASGLAGIDISGMTFDDCFGEAVFYGGAEYDGGDMDIPVVAGFDCSVRADVEVKPVDYRAMTLGACNAGASRLDRGSIHPTMLEDPLPSMVYDLTEPAALVGSSGTALFPDALISIDDDTCMAIGDEVSGSIGCVTPGAPGVCTTGAQVELTTIDTNFANASMEPEAAGNYAQIVFGSVWTTSGVKRPIAGARLTIVDADLDAGEIHYATLPTGAPSMSDLAGATATDTGGLFVAYMDRPITVIVSAPGFQSRQVRLAAADFIFGAQTIVLRP